MNQPQGRLFIISGLTGGGKTSLTQAVIKKLTEQMPLFKVVTYTTRPPRLNEQEGIDYHFVKESEFQTMQERGEFLETTVYDSHWYGSPKAILAEIAQGKSFALITDRVGAKAIKHLVPDAVLVWITVPSMEILAERLHRRGTETATAIQQRITIAAQEMEKERNEQLFSYHIMNDKFQDAVDALINVILKSTGRLQ